MVTIHRAHGLRVVILTDDHEPAHVHVFGGGHARINLMGLDGLPELVWAERDEAQRSTPRDGRSDRTAGGLSGAMEKHAWLN
jgi:hypothetical protein